MKVSRVYSLFSLILAVILVLPLFVYGDIYQTSVVGTDFDFIHSNDSDTFLCLEYKGKGNREMPDKRFDDAPLMQQAFIFVAYFDDGTSVDIAIDNDFKNNSEARTEALRYTPRLGKLPTSLRKDVERLVVHKGDTTAFSDQGLIIMYSENATKRIATHDLEETIFHESVHASWDAQHAGSSAWLQAQKSDGGFVTTYARNNPNGEDLAESALLAYTVLHNPSRIPSAERTKIQNAIPNRIAFVKKLLPPDQPIFTQVGAKYACDGSGTTFSLDGDAPASASSDTSSNTPTDTTNDTGGLALTDIMFDVLLLGLGVNESESALLSFLDQYQDASDDTLITATSKKYGFSESVLRAEIAKIKGGSSSASSSSQNIPTPGVGTNTPTDTLTTTDTLNTTVERTDQTPPPSSHVCTVGITLPRALSIGSSGNDVVALQNFLRTTGDFTYPALTGYFGSITARAVQAYQCREIGICGGSPQLNGYGNVGPRTRASIASCGLSNRQQTQPAVTSTRNSTLPPPPTTNLALFRNLFFGTRGSDVSQLQQFLAGTGDYLFSEVTGFYGSATEAAVQRYQCRELRICFGSPESNGYGFTGPLTRSSILSKTKSTSTNTAPSAPTHSGNTDTSTNGGEVVACTLEARVCPDGSEVGRIGPRCEFAACPGDTLNFTPDVGANTTVTNTTETTQSTTPNDTGGLALTDIMFDVLLLGLGVNESESALLSFLDQYQDASDDTLITATSKKYGFSESVLRAEIPKWR